MKKRYNIVYLIVMIMIIVSFILLQSTNDMLRMVLAAIAIILTSVFTYSNRK